MDNNDCNPTNWSKYNDTKYCVNKNATDNTLYDPNHDFASTTSRIFNCNFSSVYNNGTKGNPCINHGSTEGIPSM